MFANPRIYSVLQQNFRKFPNRYFSKIDVGCPSSVEDESSNEEDESRDEQTVANTEAVECFKKCLTRMERQNNVEAIQLMQLRRMMELATSTRCRNLKQTDLLEHFRQK